MSCYFFFFLLLLGEKTNKLVKNPLFSPKSHNPEIYILLIHCYLIVSCSLLVYMLLKMSGWI